MLYYEQRSITNYILEVQNKIKTKIWDIIKREEGEKKRNSVVDGTKLKIFLDIVFQFVVQVPYVLIAFQFLVN